MSTVKEKFQEAGASFGLSITQVGALFDEATNLIIEGMKSLENQEWPGLGVLISEHKEETQRKIGGQPRVIPEKIEPKLKFDNKLKKELLEEAAKLSGSQTNSKPGKKVKSPTVPPVPTNEDKTWYFTSEGTSYGPMTVPQIVASPAFAIDKSQIFNEEWGTKSWQRACDVAVIVKEFEKQRDEKLPPIPMN